MVNVMNLDWITHYTTEHQCETSVLRGDDDYRGDPAKLATGFPCGGVVRSTS